MRPDCPGSLKLMAYMDGELSPEESAPISEHLTTCPECASFLETQGSLEKSWRDSWQDPPDFCFNAMRKKLAHDRGSFRLPGWAIGIAAGAAAVFLGVRVFQPGDRPGLESRIRGEAGSQVIASDPSRTDSQTVIDSVVPLSEDVPTTEACQEETVEQAAVSPPLAETQGGTGGMDEPMPCEVTLSTGEEANYQQPLESDGYTGDLEGTALAECPDDICTSESGISSASFGAGAVGGGGCIAEEAEACVSTVCTGVAQPVGSSGRATYEVSRAGSDSDVSRMITLICERSDGVPVSPWKELSFFVDSLFQARSNLPAVFHIDPLGYTVEQDGMPRVFLGVDDPLVVPLTVRVLLH